MRARAGKRGGMRGGGQRRHVVGDGGAGLPGSGRFAEKSREGGAQEEAREREISKMGELGFQN